MTAIRSSLDAARRHLEVFEAWQADHLAAMQCRDFEEWLAEAIMVFKFVDQLVQRRRKRVFQDLEPANPELDAAERELYQRWLGVLDGEAEQMQSLEATFGVVEGAERLRACRAKARSFLADWAPAVPSMAVAHRALELTEEDADEIDAIMRDPSRGRPRWRPQPIPPGDSSQLR